MNLPAPESQYDQADEAATRRTIAAVDAQSYKRGRDVELQPGQRLILRSPDGTRWAVSVSNAGVVGAAVV
jgi:hypothetical protein